MLAISGGISLAWSSLYGLIKVGGDIDFVVGLLTGPSKVSTVIQFLADPPGWAILIAFFVGVALLLADRRYSARKATAAPAPEKEEAAPAPRPPVSQRIIQLLDYQDEHIDGYISRISVRAERHFSAPDPYIELHIRLSNASVYDMTYEGVEGRLFYADAPLRNPPEIISHSVIMGAGWQGNFTIRQFISSDLRDLLFVRLGTRQELTPSRNFKLRFSYKDREDNEKTAAWPVAPEMFDISEPAPEAKPDWNLSQAFQFWTESTDRSEAFNDELEQAAFDENITIWGKRDHSDNAVLEKIPSEHWSKSCLNLDPAIFSAPLLLEEKFILDRSRTVSRNKGDADIMQYWQIKVSSVEMKARFGT